MDIEVFAICDAATDTYGKLNLLGAFDTLMAGTFPIVHPQCSIALRVRFRRIEQGQHRLTLHLVNEDGQMVIPPMEGTIGVQVPPNQTSAVANIILQLQNIQIEKPGEYAANLAIDGRQMGSLPVFVRQMQQQAV